MEAFPQLKFLFLDDGCCAKRPKEPWLPLCRAGPSDGDLGDSVGKGKSQAGADPLSLRKDILEMESPKI